MPTLGELNAWDDDRVRAALLLCCGSTRWVQGMLAARPFRSLVELQRASDVVWRDLGPDDFREAFAHHPRIGGAPGGAAAGGSAAWSRLEQRGMQDASPETRAALALGNEEYERRFGWLFLVRATGKSADDLLAALRARLHNDPDTELRVAARELQSITRIRLENLLRARTE